VVQDRVPRRALKRWPRRVSLLDLEEQPQEEVGVVEEPCHLVQEEVVVGVGVNLSASAGPCILLQARTKQSSTFSRGTLSTSFELSLVKSGGKESCAGSVDFFPIIMWSVFELCVGGLEVFDNKWREPRQVSEIFSFGDLYNDGHMDMALGSFFSPFPMTRIVVNGSGGVLTQQPPLFVRGVRDLNLVQLQKWFTIEYHYGNSFKQTARKNRQ
jgi:hypothetical protein